MIPGGYEKHFPVMLPEVLQALVPADGKFTLMPRSVTEATPKLCLKPPIAK